MMPRSKLSATSHVLAYSNSWEEQAFAEDSAGHLGGCIWPPRSYSCSFCGREFSSAQALGGHMNVHRRERARLKESTNQCQKPSPFLRQYPSQVCTLVYNPNPNFVDATLPPPGVLLPCTQDDCSEQGFPFLSSIIQEQPKVSSQSLSLGSSNSNIERENFGVGEMGCRVPKEFAKPNFALSSSDSITHRSRMSDSGGEEEEAISSKRQKKGSSSPLLIQGERGGIFRLFPFLMTSGLGGRRIRPSGVLGQGADSSEDLDLELRLGDRPKV